MIDGPEIARVMLAAAVEGARQPRARTRETRMFWARPWDISLASFQVPLHVFVGTADPLAPFGRSLESAGAMVHSFEGGHIAGLLPAALDDIMETIASASE